MRRHNFGEDSREDDSDGDDFESVLDLDEDGNFFSITQFDRYIWRSPALGHLSLYDYPCCITHSKVRKKSRDREPISSVGRNKLKRYPYEGSGCKFPDTFTQTISTCLRVPILA